MNNLERFARRQYYAVGLLCILNHAFALDPNEPYATRMRWLRVLAAAAYRVRPPVSGWREENHGR